MLDDLDPVTLRRLQARLPAPEAPAPRRDAPVLLPIYDGRGRYISPTLTRLIALVARHSDVSPESVRGAGRVHRLVNARYCIANLAEEFASRLSARAVDDGMLRGEGLCIYYRARHRDRLEFYPDYLALHERCLAELLGRGSP